MWCGCPVLEPQEARHGPHATVPQLKCSFSGSSVPWEPAQSPPCTSSGAAPCPSEQPCGTMAYRVLSGQAMAASCQADLLVLDSVYAVPVWHLPVIKPSLLLWWHHAKPGPSQMHALCAHPKKCFSLLLQFAFLGGHLCCLYG